MRRHQQTSAYSWANTLVRGTLHVGSALCFVNVKVQFCIINGTRLYVYIFDGHHSGGSSFDSVIRCVGHTHRYQIGFKKKKKNQVRSPSIWSRISESGRDM